jgi:ornithine cyclodeaminase/alanine dehydrogenase-like protein (mu-crystallin family)
MKPLRHLSAAEVVAATPPLLERLNLAERTLRALGCDAELPPKIGVHPRQPGSLAHAMPALLRGEAADGSADLLGVKWITGFPANPGLGLATYQALVLLNDALTGEPLAVMDGGTITAQRTAAVSGAAIRHFLPGGAVSGGAVGAGAGDGGRVYRVALLGAGAQARSHLRVIGNLLPGAQVRITDVDSDRAAALASAATAVEGIGAAQSVASVREAVKSADVVISVVSFGPDRQTLDPDWLEPDVLFIAVDYDMQAPSALAREAFFVVDERDQFLATRSGPTFAGYPDPDATLGELLRGEGAARPDSGAPPRRNAGGSRFAGRVLVTHLGVGLADVVFASAILARAEQLGLGRLLPR